MAVAKNILDSRPSPAPPAIWTAFARQAAWKNWVIVAQLGVIALLILANLRLARREPDVVVIGPGGKSTYVERGVAGDALLRFIAEQKGQPSDVTVVHFTRQFLQLSLAVNSSTIEAVWPEVLLFMTPQLRVKVAAQGGGQKLVETYKLAQVRTELTIEDIVLVERTPSLLHVKATVARKKSGLVEGTAPVTSDRLGIDLVEKVVSRSAQRPDGLEIADWNVEVLSSSDQAASAASETAHAR